MDYTNLYQLVSLDIKQELVRDSELSVTAEERKKWTVNVDWTPWRNFVKDASEDYLQLKLDSEYDAKTPLWKRLPDETEPVLVATTVSVPRTAPDSDMILKIVYAVDQDGMALGFAFHSHYGSLLDKARGREPDEGEAPPEEVDMTTDYELEFYILPGSTKSIRVKAMYAEDPTKAPSDKEILDCNLFEGDVTILNDVLTESEDKK